MTPLSKRSVGLYCYMNFTNETAWLRAGHITKLTPSQVGWNTAADTTPMNYMISSWLRAGPNIHYHY